MKINQLSESNYIDAEEAEEYSRGLIQPTSENLNKFLQFLKEKWTERSKQRHDSWGDAQDRAWQPPSTLEGACKFTSLFALRLFGGRIRGNEHHQYLELPNGKIIDPVPVPDHDNPQHHDDEFWLNPEHKQSLESCLPRVKGWVNEFMSMNQQQVTEEETITELTKGVKKGSQKREKIGFASDDPSKYVGKWEEYTEPQGINSKAGKKMTKTEASIGPVRTRGMSNSSTGLGAAPPQIDIEQTPWQKKTNGKQKMAGHKAPKVVVRRNVNKSTKNKNRKLNSPVTEVFGDSSNSFPYDSDPSGWTTIDVGIEGLEVVVGMEDIKSYNPDLPPGVNIGMVTQTENGINMGIEPAKVGMSTKDTIKLFNTLMNITREYVEVNDPDRLYFVAVKPMEGIYQRLIRRFVNTDEWNIKIIKGVPIPMIGGKLNAYMIEKKNLVTEANRLPAHKQFNADYDVQDGEEMVAKATVNDGVIDEFMIRDDIGNDDFRGKYMSGMMSAIVRDADMTNSNMSMQINDQDDLEMKRFLERFGFRHVGDGVFRRTAGAITPPSVIY